MIRLVDVDDHPAVLAGLLTVLEREVGVTACGAARGAGSAVEEVRNAGPDLVLTDFQLEDGDGLSLCRTLSLEPEPPRVLLYSAYADERLAAAALVAGAEGLVAKGAPVDDILEAVRLGSRGELVLPRLPEQVLTAAAQRLDPLDMPVFAMRIARTPVAEIAETLRIPSEHVETRIDMILATLRQGLGTRESGLPAPRETVTGSG
jgi:DNA-binding NarL/FixJ family response regulator